MCKIITPVYHLRNHFASSLEGFYSREEAFFMFYLLLEKKMGISKIEASFLTELTPQDTDYLHFVIQELKTHKPIQYILGVADFYGKEFKVNPHTLIPRQETEELVEQILKHLQNQSNLKILDIGTGTGCIVIALASLMPHHHYEAWDISENALQTAQQNAERYELNIAFETADIFNVSSLKTWDIIISNPPYVRHSEKSFIKQNVTDFEPETALFVPDNDPLLFYKTITVFAAKHLNPNGLLFFEINEVFGKEMQALLQEFGFSEIELWQDFHGKDRFIKGKRTL